MSESRELNVVTGAFSYAGQYITRRLLDSGRRVRTITGHPGRPHSFEKRVEVAPLDFTDYAGMVCASGMRLASCLFTANHSIHRGADLEWIARAWRIWISRLEALLLIRVADALAVILPALLGACVLARLLTLPEH